MANLTAKKALVFRITHIDNVPWILKNGIHCRNSQKRDPNFREIGNPELIVKRGGKPVPAPPGGTLSDYVPFYFTSYSPMLLNIKTGHNGMRQTPMKDIVIMVSSLHKLVEFSLPFLFTDRHAYVVAAQFSSDLKDLARIDWRILQARDFKRDPDDPGKTERYQAEALIHSSLPVNGLLGMICYSAAQETHLNGELKKAAVSLKVVSNPDWFF